MHVEDTKELALLLAPHIVQRPGDANIHAKQRQRLKDNPRRAVFARLQQVAQISGAGDVVVAIPRIVGAPTLEHASDVLVVVAEVQIVLQVVCLHDILVHLIVRRQRLYGRKEVQRLDHLLRQPKAFKRKDEGPRHAIRFRLFRVGSEAHALGLGVEVLAVPVCADQEPIRMPEPPQREWEPLAVVDGIRQHSVHGVMGALSSVSCAPSSPFDIRAIAVAVGGLRADAVLRAGRGAALR